MSRHLETMPAAAEILTLRPKVYCATCLAENPDNIDRALMFDGECIRRTKAVRLTESGAEALCKRCKSWVPVPARYQPLSW